MPRKLFWSLSATLAVLMIYAGEVWAADGHVSRLHAWWVGWLDKIGDEILSPLFWFGMLAQAMFFLRFFWQWIVSERRHHSTVPIAFWYFSLAGGLAMFIYAFLLPNLVIMLGQLLACTIYLRNLMLIYGQAKHRRLAGLPRVKLRSEVNGENDADSGY